MSLAKKISILQLADAELGYRKGKAEIEQTIDALGDAILQ